MNMYSALITAGVCIILAGVTAMLFLYSAGVREVLGVVTLLSCIAIAVAIFPAEWLTEISCGKTREWRNILWSACARSAEKSPFYMPERRCSFSSESF